MIEIDWPKFGVAACPPRPSCSELEARIGNLQGGMEERKITHIVVYGDREHFANLTYLTGSTPGSKRRSLSSTERTHRGIEMPEEVLPLSNSRAIVPSFFLSANTVIALET